MAKVKSVQIPEFIPAEPDLLPAVVKRLLMVALATGSILMLVGFVVATFVALF